MVRDFRNTMIRKGDTIDVTFRFMGQRIEARGYVLAVLARSLRMEMHRPVAGNRFDLTITREMYVNAMPVRLARGA